MQEEVESKSVNLAVRTTTVTARVLYQALRSYMQDTKNMVANSRARAQTRQQMKLTKQQIKAAGKNTPVRGKQTVKQLMSQGQNVDCTDISKEDINVETMDADVSLDGTQTIEFETNTELSPPAE